MLTQTTGQQKGDHMRARIIWLSSLLLILLAASTAYAVERMYVYVSNANSGDISMYSMNPQDGKLTDIGKAKAGNAVMPMAVSPDQRFLYASIRSLPYRVASYAIDSGTGKLEMLSTVPLAESMAFISTDWTGRFLFGASFGSDIISVNPIGRNGFAQAEVTALVKIGRHAHAILPDPSNRFVYATNLGNDQLLHMNFDEKTGALTPASPATASAKPDSGPRHFCFTPNNRFAYVLNELNGTITCYNIDPATGHLTERQSFSLIPPGTDIVPGSIRPPLTATGTVEPEKNTKPVIWAADIHITPNGKFVYASERTTSTLACFIADPLTGKLVYTQSIKTETQPRGFNIDPKGKYLVAAGEKSNHISVYAISQTDGTLSLVERYAAGDNPNWVEIVHFQ